MYQGQGRTSHQPARKPSSYRTYRFGSSRSSGIRLLRDALYASQELRNLTFSQTSYAVVFASIVCRRTLGNGRKKMRKPLLPDRVRRTAASANHGNNLGIRSPRLTAFAEFPPRKYYDSELGTLTLTSMSISMLD
ncbi:uncharacterized protein LOC109504300 isoform X1 [Harpegnathos saltator]|uniref:uncharacterized protein LOC109504300 isoform X1 n=1 Tax=Harpegnathos saltator TaxID=610380 RepID=UPI000DBEDE88|nr:uncharacterized protein LOC109504300 isoform X1 [Harpegnathos saltator]